MSVDELEALLGVDLPRGDWVSVGGLIIGLTGRIPVPGDSVSAGGYRFEVKRADDKRVRQVEVSQLD
jgi:CBS domain containing-hemolysin-like protein